MADKRKHERRAGRDSGAGATAPVSHVELRRAIAAGFALAALAGCGHPDGPRTEETVPIVAPGGNGGNIEAIAVDGVWFFRLLGGWGEQALFVGEASIDGDCLLVGERVVIWSVGQASLAVELIAEVRSGAAPVVRLGGGESSDVPAMVADRCAVEAVWRTNSYEAAR